MNRTVLKADVLVYLLDFLYVLKRLLKNFKKFCNKYVFATGYVDDVTHQSIWMHIVQKDLNPVTPGLTYLGAA